MSEIKVNSIKGVAASTAAITVNNTDGTCTANITNKPNRNLIINGAMLVAQRGTSSTSAGYTTVDRFVFSWSGTDESPTQEQADVASGTTPYSLGFRKSYKVTNGNQTGGAGSSDYVRFYQVIESQNIASSGWNYVSSSSNITLSFWIKSSVAQNFYGYFLTQDGSAQMYPYETGSLSADTWTKVTKTIPGNSNLQFDNDANQGFYFFLWPFAGTDFTNNSATNDAWTAYSGTARMKDATSTWYTTNDATLEITGVQLEVGSVATDFEHRSFGEELALCQRYYQQSYQTGTSAGTNTATNAINWYPDATTNYSSVSFGLPCVMRTQPTVTIYSRTGASGKIRNADASTDHNSYVNTNNNSFLMLTVNNSSISQSSTVSCHYTASAEL